jgi:hypothetical protein
VRIDSRVVSHGQAPTDSMTPTTKLAHPFHCLLERGGERLTASFSNFVVADHRADHAVRAAIPFAEWRALGSFQLEGSQDQLSWRFEQMIN